jgi:hypothetical protein
VQNPVVKINPILCTFVKKLESDFILITVYLDLVNFENLYRQYVTLEPYDLIRSLKLCFDVCLHNTRSKDLFKYQANTRVVTLGHIFEQMADEVDPSFVTAFKYKILGSSMLRCFKAKLISQLTPMVDVTAEGLLIKGLGKVVDCMLKKDQSPRCKVTKSKIRSKSGAIFPFQLMAKFARKIKEPTVARRKAKTTQAVEPVNPDNLITEYEYLSFYNKYEFDFNQYKVNVSVKVVQAASQVARPSFVVSIYM